MNTEKILDYLMTTPYNTNEAVLLSMLGEGNWDKLLSYVRFTPQNMNREVLKALLGGTAPGTSSVVGQAVVGMATI